jgi:hypothetical protein
VAYPFILLVDKKPPARGTTVCARRDPAMAATSQAFRNNLLPHQGVTRGD